MNFMNNTNPIIIGIDHGYGNIKTAHCCFKTGVVAYDKEPTFKSNLLVYEGRYYLIGEEHKEFISDKMTDSDYYILTLAAVAREEEDAFLKRITEAIEQGLRFAPVGMLPFTLHAAVETPSAEDDENISAALDFADSF